MSKFLKVTGQSQGEIKGDVTVQGRENAIAVAAFSHNLGTPTDSATGRASGSRRHGPLIIVKTIDKSTPLLYQALTTNEGLPNVTIHFDKGSQADYFIIALENARISSINQVKQQLEDQSDTLKFGEYEEVSFVYEKIRWTFTDGGIEAEDSVGGTS